MTVRRCVRILVTDANDARRSRDGLSHERLNLKRKGGRPRRPPSASLGLHDLSPYFAILDATTSTSSFGRAPFGRGHSPASALLRHVRIPLCPSMPRCTSVGLSPKRSTT